MFITTQHNPSALDPKQRAMTWPGPRIVLADFDGQPTQDWIASAEVHYLVVDLAARAESRFDALRIAITRTTRARIKMGGPLLYTNNGLPDNEVERLEQAARQDPWLIEFTTDPVDGKFSILVLGEKIVTNPLFKNFFTNLHEGITEMQTGNCIALMEKHLVWRKEGKNG
jgi:hypothetical protein